MKTRIQWLLAVLALGFAATACDRLSGPPDEVVQDAAIECLIPAGFAELAVIVQAINLEGERVLSGSAPSTQPLSATEAKALMRDEIRRKIEVIERVNDYTRVHDGETWHYVKLRYVLTREYAAELAAEWGPNGPLLSQSEEVLLRFIKRGNEWHFENTTDIPR